MIGAQKISDQTFDTAAQNRQRVSYWDENYILDDDEEIGRNPHRLISNHRMIGAILASATTETKIPIARDQRRQSSGLPDYSLSDRDPDKISADTREIDHIRIYRSWHSLKQQILFFLILSFVGVHGSWSLPVMVPTVCAPGIFSSGFCLSLPVLLIPAAVILFRMLLRVYDSYLEFDRNHLRLVSGVVSSSRKEIEIPFESILFVQVDQKMMERLSGVGTISVGHNNSHLKSEITMNGVKNPYGFTRIIKERMAECRAHQREVAN